MANIVDETMSSLSESYNQGCDNCGDTLVFELERKDGERFSVGLSTILDCICEAVKRGDLMKLPPYWVREIQVNYGIFIPADCCFDECHTCYPWKKRMQE